MLKGKPAPTNLQRQFNENGARCQLKRTFAISKEIYSLASVVAY
jgi:hypothetical protein